MAKHEKRANSKRDTGGTFGTPGGQTYLENLKRLQPTELTQRAIAKVKEEDAHRDKRAAG